MVVIGPVGEFFIELARENGLYNAPNQRLGAVSGWVAAVVLSYPFGVLAGAVFGFAGGVWIDLFLKRKESDPDLTEESLALADRLEALAGKISELKGECNAEAIFAWAEDSEAFSATGTTRRVNDLKLRAKTAQRFNSLYAVDMFRGLAEAKKLISFDDFPVRHISGDRLDDIPQFLLNLATDLRVPRPDMPETEVLARAQSDVKRLAAQLAELKNKHTES